MFKKTVLATSVALGMGMAGAAQADLFQFNPTGGGAGAGVINNVATIDEAPGNSLGQAGSVSVPGGGPLTPGTTIMALYQANLTAMLGAASNVLFANGTGGNFFTFVAGFNETVTTSTQPGGPGTTVSTTFNVNPGGFFKICAQSALGNDLAGTGFSCAGNGILSGSILSGNATQAGFPATLANLDGSPNGNQRGTTQTVTSSGAANLTLQVNFANTGFFPDLFTGATMVISMTNTSNITPFNQVDPSFAFSSNGTANGDVPDNIGAVNGITGPNFQFQADANTAFTRIAVPEPATLALLSLGLFAIGGVLRRRSRLTNVY